MEKRACDEDVAFGVSVEVRSRVLCMGRCIDGQSENVLWSNIVLPCLDRKQQVKDDLNIDRVLA